jgi:beta-lactamase superfamily II metal-dependent hydrolase
VLDSGFNATTQTYEDYISSVGQRTLQLANRGSIIPLGHGVNVTILNPTQPLEFEDSNDNSIVLRLQVNNVTFLLTGDSEAPSEASILSASYSESCTIIKVGHHGSRTSSTPEYLEAVDPEVAVICVGTENRYDHPHTETLDKLTIEDVTIYRTDIHGTVKITTDGANYYVQIEKASPTQPLTPEPDPESAPETTPELEPEPESESEPESKVPIPGFNLYHTAAGILTAIAVISWMSKKT